MASTNSFGARDTLSVGEKAYEIYRIGAVAGSDSLPYSLKVLLENLLRTEDGANITADHIRALGSWDEKAEPDTEIRPWAVVARSSLGARPRPDRSSATPIGGPEVRTGPHRIEAANGERVRGGCVPRCWTADSAQGAV